MRSIFSLFLIFSLLFQSTTLAYPNNRLNTTVSSAAPTLFDGGSLIDELEKNLANSGFVKEVSGDGKVTLWSKGQLRYSIRKFSKSFGDSPSIDFTDLSKGSRPSLKIRLKE
ncbi:MAG: hypothetical protein H6620_10695 [Halobacteriovoraceae bacterium]|nr:hypothetical protein [Halobacteriovoraceae bacterium]